jgi:hypothetical protein
MVGKTPSEKSRAGDRRPAGEASHPGSPEPSQAATYPQHKEAFAALLALAAKPLNKID